MVYIEINVTQAKIENYLTDCHSNRGESTRLVIGQGCWIPASHWSLRGDKVGVSHVSFIDKRLAGGG